MASFRKFHERYRWGKLEADVAALEAGCWVRMLAHVQTFDVNGDGYIGADEMQAYLLAVGAWEKHIRGSGSELRVHPLGFFLCTSTPCIWGILSVFLPS